MCRPYPNTLHFLIYKGVRFYLPIIRAILKKENTRREKTNQIPLKMSLNFLFQDSYSGYDRIYHQQTKQLYYSDRKNSIIFTRNWDEHHYYVTKETSNLDKNHLYIHILDGKLQEKYCVLFSDLLEKQHYRYRDSNAKEKDPCYDDEKITKTFETGDDLIRFMSQDICSDKE